MREGWIDWAKAVAIVAVVWIHAGPPSSKSAWAVRLTMVAVPCFFFVSGYTLARSPVTRERVAQRLGRIALPYLVASTLVIAWNRQPVESVPSMMVAGWALGIYYFVPMLVVCTAVVALALRSRWWLALLALCCALTLLSMAGRDPIAGYVYPRLPGLFGLNRSPTRWVGYVAAGALLARLAQPMQGWAPPELVKRLASATLPVYLYHWPVLSVALALGVQIYGRVALGVAVPFAATMLLDRYAPRARRWFG